MNIEEIKEYIKNNEKEYDKKTIKQRLRNNGAKLEDINKAYSIFSFSEIEDENNNKIETKLLELEGEIQSSQFNLLNQPKTKGTYALILAILGLFIPTIGILFAIIALILANQSLEEFKENKIAMIARILAIITIIFKVIRFLLLTYSTEIVKLFF